VGCGLPCPASLGHVVSTLHPTNIASISCKPSLPITHLRESSNLRWPGWLWKDAETNVERAQRVGVCGVIFQE
jgi:hypothetical protein